MAVRFIVGRAGSGKTHACLEAIRERLRADPIDGPRLILLVPEQASLQMERAILQPPDAPGSTGDIPGSHRSEVFSFQRLAYRVFDSAGGPLQQALSEPARAMVLRHLLAVNADRLRYYRRAAKPGSAGGRFGGLVERLGATIAELIQEAIDPDDLPVAEETVDSASGAAADSARGAKLHDLRIIYAAYLEYLGGDQVDPSQSLQLARARLGQCAWLDGAEVWVDGFASFSGQETLTLIEVAKKCRSIDITVMMDPGLCETSAGAPATSRDAARMFAKTRRTFQDLRDRFVRAGLAVDEPLVLDPSPPPRFGASRGLAALERGLLTGNRSAESDDLSGIEIVELPSRRVEVKYAVSRIRGWVEASGGRLRYRDTAIIVRDLEPYHDLLTDELSALDVPLFIDRRQPVAHHPLVELLRTAALMVRDDFSLESVRVLLKTGLLPVSTDEGDELENYLLAHGIHGNDAWQREWSYRKASRFVRDPDDQPTAYETQKLARVNETRKALLDAWAPWLGVTTGGRTLTGGEWRDVIRDWLDRLGVADTMKRWADRSEARGDIAMSEQHRQVWRELMSYLDDLGMAFQDVPLTVLELADVLAAGLSGLTLGLVPPTVDQVLVGSIERSRHPDIKAAVILGFNDGVFPKRHDEDAILNDDDRAAIRDAGLEVRPPSRERILEEALLTYVALTRASEQMVVTYATADNHGKALRPSPHVQNLTGACPTLSPICVGDPTRSRDTWDVLSRGDLTERLTMEFRQRPALVDDDQAVRGRWNALYDSVLGDRLRDPVARFAFRSLGDRQDTRLSPDVVERLHGGSLHLSVSQLEKFAACPFQHFARYVLKLEERAVATLEAVDIGQVHHAVLEDFVAALKRRGVNWDQLSDRESLDELQASSMRIAARLCEVGGLTDARNAYQLRRTASTLARMIKAQRRRTEAGRARPLAAELPFGFDQPGGLPALMLSTPAGRRVQLRGYIDRVDIAELGDELLGLVIDYKTTRDRRLDLSEAYHGLSLQLLGYLMVLAECGHTLAGRPIRPIGSLYVSLASQYVKVDHPDACEGRDQRLGGSYRPRGLILADEFDALDASCDSGWSDHYSFHRKKDGGIGQIDKSDAADAPSFRAMLDHTRQKLGQLADELIDGNIAVRPYRLGTFSPCDWCSMSSVCRFEMGISDVRYLQPMKRSEIFGDLTRKS